MSKRSDELTRLLTKIIRSQEAMLSDFSVYYLKDEKRKRPSIQLDVREIRIPRGWKVEQVLTGIAPMIRAAIQQMHYDAREIDTKIESEKIALHRAIEYLQMRGQDEVINLILQDNNITVTSNTEIN